MGNLKNDFDESADYNLVTVTVTTSDTFARVLDSSGKLHLVPATREKYFEAEKMTLTTYRLNEVEVLRYEDLVTKKPTSSVNKKPYAGLQFEGGFSLDLVLSLMAALEVQLISHGEKFVHHDEEFNRKNKHFHLALKP